MINLRYTTTITIFILLIVVVIISLAFPACAQGGQDTSNKQFNSAASIKNDSIIGRVYVDSGKTTYASTVDTVIDTVPFKKQPYQPIPKKAGLYSAILPGLGQVYNHQIWKVPIIYAAAVFAGYFILDDYNNYQMYRKAYIGRINNPYPTDKFVNIYTPSQLQQLQSDYYSYLDMAILYTVFGFGAQVIDAIASAHLKNFDVSRDITIKVKPVLYPNTVGIGLVIGF